MNAEKSGKIKLDVSDKRFGQRLENMLGLWIACYNNEKLGEK